MNWLLEPVVLKIKTFALLLLAACALSTWGLWITLRPVEIIAVHEKGSHSSVLVKSFPLTDKGKINWWLKKKAMLKNKYSIPKPDQEGYFVMVFWYFGDGYKEEGKYDRRCFDDTPPPLNCIEKDKAFTVWTDRHNNVFFGVHDGKYRINDKGQMIKTKY
ncbi:DUF943 family protein [Cedecea neteri]|uniref:DUF943 family protein n=1 Tax=Cedecea neteri TaxID=158822 RepID=UPI002892F3FB|nr:DUF943 family protein [Cedecea neteri]WNJ78433.1 DUF943 family protein [Cedecea neteri]